MVRDPNIFSMSNIRDVTARMVSAFFYASPHSPQCARIDPVVSDSKNDALDLFCVSPYAAGYHSRAVYIFHAWLCCYHSAVSSIVCLCCVSLVCCVATVRCMYIGSRV